MSLVFGATPVREERGARRGSIFALARPVWELVATNRGPIGDLALVSVRR